MTTPVRKPDHTMVEVYKTSSAVLFTDRGRETYRAMALHVQKLAGAYGREHRWVIDAALSFARVSESMVGWGNVNVGKDGDLALICNERTPSGDRGIEFGLIFHGVKRGCTNPVEGTERTCSVITNDDGKTWKYLADYPECAGPHALLYPLDAPMPGEWSFHS